MQAAFEERMSDTGGVFRRFWTFVREVLSLFRIAVRDRAREPAQSWMSTREGMKAGFMSTWMHDLHHGVRALQRRRTLTVLAVLTFGLGIGASTAMFSVVDAVLLRPLQFTHPEQLVYVFPTIEEWKTDPVLRESWERGYWSQYEIQQYGLHQKSFSAIGAYNASSGRVRNGRGSERIATSLVTSGLLKTLGTKPLLGRFFTDDEPQPVVVISYDFWQSRYGGDASVIGRALEVDGDRSTIVGVLPQNFELPEAPSRIFRPLQMAPGADYSKLMGNHMFPKLIGRLKPNVTPEYAQAEAAALFKDFAPYGEAHRTTHNARVVRPLDELTKHVRTPLLLLATASVILLMVACANVALLLLAAGMERTQEIAVRGALGAGARRIARQLLIETMLLSTAGSVLGLAFALAISKLLVFLAPAGLPRIDHVAIDVRTFGFAIIVTFVVGIIVALFPALSLSRTDPASVLRAATTVGGRQRVQGAIVVMELALATVLLVGAGLLTRTMNQLDSVQPGFNADNLITVEMALPYDRFANMPGVRNSDDMAKRVDVYFAGLMDQVRALPGVSAVATTSSLPFTTSSGSNTVEPEGYTPSTGELLDAQRHFVSGNYFDVMQIRPIAGRTFTTAEDRPDADKVIVVDEHFAKRFWPDGRGVDRHVSFWDNTYRVVGVVPDVIEHDVRGEKDEIRFYVPGRQVVGGDGDLLIRTAGDPSLLISQVRSRLWEFDPDISITSIMPMRERITGTLAEYRYRMRLMLAFACLAALFSVLGVYGITNRSVARRTQELGIRLALGARPRTVLSHVLSGGVRLAIIGGAVGLAVSFYAARLLQSMLWGVPAADPVTFGGIAVGVVLLCILATLAPARRASKLDPMMALRP
jgi:putative ABC transport system permease protein